MTLYILPEAADDMSVGAHRGVGVAATAPEPRESFGSAAAVSTATMGG